jgi:hypothetical protein
VLTFYTHTIHRSAQLLDINPGGTEELTGKRISGMVSTMERKRRSVELSAERKRAPRRRIIEPRAVLCCAVLQLFPAQEVRMPFGRPDGILQAEEDGLRGRRIGSALLHVACGVEWSGAVR